MGMINIAVLGCGPTGLVTAQSLRHFAHAAGLPVQVGIYSQKQPSYIAGAQYLHERVPGIHAPDANPEALVKVTKRGTKEGYATKVYGSPDAPVSWERYEEHHYPAWNMRNAYRALWDEWADHVTDVTLTPAKAAQMASTGQHDAVINTVPLSALCQRNGESRMAVGPEHSFVRQEVHVQQVEGAFAEDHPSEILYNGESEPSWYRKSSIFGTISVEWSGQGPKPPLEDVVTITKPLVTNCDCYAETAVPWMNVGRYGAYEKEFLSHHAILHAAQMIRRMAETHVPQ